MLLVLTARTGRHLLVCSSCNLCLSKDKPRSKSTELTSSLFLSRARTETISSLPGMKVSYAAQPAFKVKHSMQHTCHMLSAAICQAGDFDHVGPHMRADALVHVCTKQLRCVLCAAICRQVTFTVMGLVCGLTFYQLDVGTFEALQARTNLIFFNMIALVVLPFVSLSLYTNDKKMYLADASSKLYRPSCFYLAKVSGNAMGRLLRATQRCRVTFSVRRWLWHTCCGPA